jgi:hypothetical protein
MTLTPSVRDVPKDAIHGAVPDIHAEGEVGLGLHGQVRLDSSWPLLCIAHVIASRSRELRGLTISID